jgi:carbamoyltransferase
MIVLGIGGLLDDAAAALLIDGQIVAAVEEKKIARKHAWGNLPVESIEACLKLGKIDSTSVEVVSLARPFAAGPDSLISLRLKQILPNARMLVVEHHTAHAASAYFASPFDEATVLTVDRAGDLRCSARWKASHGQLVMDREAYFPDSVGDLYGRVTELLGYAARADEHKVQWLSAAGDTRFQPLFEDILGFASNGWPQLDRSYFDRDRMGAGGFSAKLYQALGLSDGEKITAALKSHIASGLQKAVEACMLAMAGEGDNQCENLCLAGGVAFNAMAVQALEASGRWKNVFVQPAAGNAGTALGAAYLGANLTQCQPLETLALGPGYTAEEVKQVLENCKLSPKYLLTVEEMIHAALAELKDQKIIAWFQERMEFGPRALGNRSILASPLNPYATENLNSFIKHREAYRKFAAAVPEECAAEYFDCGPNARFLASISRVKPEHRKTFAPALLGDGWIRLQVVSKQENPLFHKLLMEAGDELGMPVLYNTSFNLFGEALVCSPRDAVRSFYSSGIDVLFVGNFLLRK